MIIPFACQHRGQSVRAVVADYHDKAAGKAISDYSFHIIVTDPTDQVVGQELPALIRAGYTSYKIYLTYDRLKIDDRQALKVLAFARRDNAMVMVHAENHDVIKWIPTICSERAEARRNTMRWPMIASRKARQRTGR